MSKKNIKEMTLEQFTKAHKVVSKKALIIGSICAGVFAVGGTSAAIYFGVTRNNSVATEKDSFLRAIDRTRYGNYKLQVDSLRITTDLTKLVTGPLYSHYYLNSDGSTENFKRTYDKDGELFDELDEVSYSFTDDNNEKHTIIENPNGKYYALEEYEPFINDVCEMTFQLGNYEKYKNEGNGKYTAVFKYSDLGGGSSSEEFLKDVVFDATLVIKDEKIASFNLTSRAFKYYTYEIPSLNYLDAKFTDYDSAAKIEITDAMKNFIPYDEHKVDYCDFYLSPQEAIKTDTDYTIKIYVNGSEEIEDIEYINNVSIVSSSGGEITMPTEIGKKPTIKFNKTTLEEGDSVSVGCYYCSANYTRTFTIGE